MEARKTLLPPPAERDCGIDLIKAFAIFGVLLIHASPSALNRCEPASFSWFSALFWGSVSRASVPLFFMCTGFLFLRPEKPCSLQKLFTRSLPRILLALFFWAAVYKLYPLILSGSVTPGALVQVLKDILLFRHESHFYYLHITILIYLCVPLLRVFTANASRRQLQYALLLWALCAVVYPTIKPLWPFSLLSGIPAQYAINLTWGSLGYCLLGYSLRTETAIRRWVFPVLWAGGFLLTTGSTAWASLREGALQTRYLEGMSIGVAVMAAGIFGTLCSLSPGCRGQKLLSLVSQASFTVYLSHLIFLNKLVGLLGDRAIALPLLTIPLLAFLAFACSFVLWLVLRKIPFVRRWLI